MDRRLVNINNEQDLITLLGSEIVPAFRQLGIRLEDLLLSGEDDEGLGTLFERHGMGLRHIPYRRSPRCRSLGRFISRWCNLRYFARSGKDSTLYAKSAIGYREGEFNLRRYRKTRLAGIPAQLLRFLEPALVRLYIRAMEGLDAVDAPVLCLDYIHNDFHLELWSLNRALGKPYIAYVANLDQVTNYAPHLDLADHILVWGAFHEDVLAGHYGIVTRKLIRVGFCRSDSLAGISAAARNPGAGALHVVYFCASNLSNDPGFAQNLTLLLEALEENAAPYVLALKKHPSSGTELWDRHFETVRTVPLRHGRMELVGNTWDKFSKLEKQRLADKDFSYRDLEDLFVHQHHHSRGRHRWRKVLLHEYRRRGGQMLPIRVPQGARRIGRHPHGDAQGPAPRDLPRPRPWPPRRKPRPHPRRGGVPRPGRRGRRACLSRGRLGRCCANPGSPGCGVMKPVP